MNVIRILLSTICLLQCSFSIAQKEAIRWYFGNHAALDFSSGVPVTITGSAMVTSEGSACISDGGGNLLFYTDGVTVFNKLNQPMPNGTGLKGHASSTQSALIVPRPAAPGSYYIFTTDAGEYIDPPNEGCHYSEVNMALDNGNGDVLVSSKNTLLLDSCTEKLAGVKHLNNSDFWVVTHGWKTNLFYAYQVTNAGVNPVPVISAAGSIHQGNDDNTIGQMKISPQGNKLALAVNIDGFFELFDFDRATGIVSNPLLLQIPQFISAYGVEFSPNGNRLYVSTLYFNSVYQYDLAAGSPAAILASQTIIGSSGAGISYGSMQLAPDGKIYLALASGMNGNLFIARIANPNLLGTACGFQNNAFNLSPNRSWYGLPNFLSSYFLTTSADETSVTNTPVKFYYNMTQDIFNISLQPGFKAKLLVINAEGKKILDVSLASGNHSVPLELPAAGIYFVRITGTNFSEAMKIASIPSGQ